MYKGLHFLILYLLPIHLVFGHNGSIRGAIYDKETNLPLVGANITIVGTSQGTTSDMFGVYQFTDLAAGTYQLRISFLGFQIDNKTIEVIDDQTSTVASYLLPAQLELSEVMVTPRSNTVLTPISTVDIKLRPVRSSQDILRMVPGLFIAQHAGGGKAEQIFLRGFDIDHGTDINLTVDGMPVNMVSHAHGQGYADLHFLIPETVEQVDFGKGPYYTAKGDFTTAGYVDFQTKNALKKNLLKLEGGQFDTFRGVMMLDLLGEKAKSRNQNAYIASEYFFSNGYFESPQNFNRLNLFGKYNQYIDENKILTFSLSTFSSKWDASGQIPQRAVDTGMINRFGAIDNTEGGQTRRSNANLQFTHLLPDGSVLKNQLFATHTNFELYSNFTFFLNDSINGDQIRQKEIRNIFGYAGSYSKESTLLNKNVVTQVGVGIRYDNVPDSELSRTKSRKITTAPLSRGNIDQTNTYVYVDETVELTPQLTLNAGVRLDGFNFSYVDNLDSTFSRKTVSKGTVSPKLNLYYDVHSRLRLFINTGIGFHSNDTRVVVLQNGRDILPKAYGAEIGTIFKPNPKLLINTSLWRLDLDQEFVYVGDEGVVEPSGKSRRYGLDFSLRYQLLNWLFVDTDINVSLPRALGTQPGEYYIPLAPLHTSIGGLSFKFTNGLNGSLRYRFLGNRPANSDNSVVASGYWLTDIVVNYTRPRYEVSLVIENLTNQKWKEAQFDTESRLRGEREPVSEIHFTPGSPFLLKAGLSYFF